MAYIRHYQAKGDPFIPALIGIAGKLGAGALLGGVAKKVVGGAIGKLGGIAGKILKSKGARAVGGAAAAGAAFEVGQRTMRGPRAPAAAGGRRRRMNVTNPRALRRAMSRVQGFAKLASKTISFTKRVRMKKRGRR